MTTSVSTAESLPAEPQRPTLDRRHVNLVFGVIMLGMLLAALDQTIVSTALPTIVGDLDGQSHVSWVVTSYLLSQTIATVLAGRLGDLFGRKRVFQLSAALFVAASALCGLATSMAWLITARGVQGIGGGGLTVTATALIADVVPLRERGEVPGRARRGLRRCHSGRAAAGWLLHRLPELAVVLLRQSPDRHPGRGGGRARHPRHPEHDATSDRLPRRAVHRARGRRADAVHELGWHGVPLVLDHERRARRGVPDRHRAVRARRTPRGRTESCRCGCSAVRCSR